MHNGPEFRRTNSGVEAPFEGNSTRDDPNKEDGGLRRLGGIDIYIFRPPTHPLINSHPSKPVGKLLQLAYRQIPED